MLTSELVVVIGGTLLFFGFAVAMAIYSRKNRQTEEPGIEHPAAAANVKTVEPQPIAAEQPPELRPKRKIAGTTGYAPESLKSAVEEMRKSGQTIGVRNKTKLAG
jgi:hypothetical protein